MSAHWSELDSIVAEHPGLARAGEHNGLVSLRSLQVGTLLRHLPPVSAHVRFVTVQRPGSKRPLLGPTEPLFPIRLAHAQTFLAHKSLHNQ